MEMSEMPLTLFTLFMQLAVGAFIAVETVRFVQSKRFDTAGDCTANKVVYATFIVAVVGLLASFFHLKVPLHAPFALTNFATSWMTREIWFSVIFVTLLLVYCFLLFRKSGSRGLRSGLAVFTALVGLVLVFCMANAYMNPANPVWNTPATVATFYATAFLIGPSFAAALLSLLAPSAAKKAPEAEAALSAMQSGTLKFAAVVGMIALAVTVIATVLNICDLASSGSFAALASVSYLAGEMNTLFVARLVLVFAGVGLLGCALYCNMAKASAQPRTDGWVIAACAMLLIAEFIGRSLFYASSVQIGF